MPILPGDEIITGNNAGVTIRFPDGTETKLTSAQHWMWREYSPDIGQQTGSFTVDNYWYYGSMEHAQSIPESRIPNQTLFDAYTRIGDGAIVSQIPREISLVLDKTTEIDFQKYFPYDTLSSVEIFRLPSSEWRKVNATTVAFEMQKEKREILVRITSRGFVRDYTTTLITRPPTLGIKSIDTNGKIS